MRLPLWLVGLYGGWIIERAARTPYWRISDYMGRDWAWGGSFDDDRPYCAPDPFGRPMRTWRKTPLDWCVGAICTGRIHHILRPDRGRDMHNHPAGFTSLILRGGYLESLPRVQRQHPILDTSDQVQVRRDAGDIACRARMDRHRIDAVQTGTVTLCVFWLPCMRRIGTLLRRLIGLKPAARWGFFRADPRARAAPFVPFDQYDGEA